MRLAAVALAALALVALGAGVARADKCTGAKLKALAKKESALLACQARVATAGSTVEPACDNKAIGKFTTAYNKPGTCGNPDASVCESIADDCRDALRAALPDGNATTPSRCEAARLKAAGKKAAAKLSCYAKAAAKNAPVDGGCLGKANTKFLSAFNKVTGCTGDGQAASIESLIDSECVDEVVTIDMTGTVLAICPAGPTTTTTAPPMSTSTTTTTTPTPTTTTSTTATTTTAITPTTTTTTTPATTTTVASTTTLPTLTTTTTTSTTTTTTTPCHDVCSTGAAMPASCSACTMAVCAQDPQCCTDGWTNVCVSEACTVCGPSEAACPGTPCA